MTSDANSKLPARFGFLLIDDFTLISMSSVVETLRMANRLAGVDHYQWKTISEDGTAVSASDGIPIGVAHGIADSAVLQGLDTVIVCGGLGLLIASATVREGSPDAQLCLIGNIPKLAITLMIILAFSSLNIQLRGNLFLSSLINGVCVLLPSAMVSDDNRWLMFCSSTLRTSFGLLGKCDVNSATDLAVSLATASCMFVVLPWLVAKEVRTLYTSCLLWGGGLPVPAVTAKRKNR